MSSDAQTCLSLPWSVDGIATIEEWKITWILSKKATFNMYYKNFQMIN